MKDNLITLSIREIKKSFKRFLSLLIMSFLGVAVFVGLKNTKDVLIESLDKYYDNSNFYDISIISTLGLSEEDEKELKELDLIDESYGIHSKDVYFNYKDKKYVLRIYGINSKINNVVLKEGHLPKNDKEIVVEEYLLRANKLKIGDTITIDDPDNKIKNTKYTISGIILSPLYLQTGGPALLRGSSTIGSGQVNFYSYVNDENLELDYFTEIDLTVKGAKNYTTNSEEYKKIIDYALGEVRAIRKYREQARYDEIYKELIDQVNNNEKQGNLELDKANIELENAKNQLNSGYYQLVSNKNLLNDKKNELNNSYNELMSAKEQIDNGKSQLEDARGELNSSKQEIESILNNYHLSLNDVYILMDLLDGKGISKEEFKSLVGNNNPYKEDIYYAIDYIYDNHYLEMINECRNKKLLLIKNTIIKYLPKDMKNYDKVVLFISKLTLSDINRFIFNSVFDTNNIEIIKNHIPSCCSNYDNIIHMLDYYENNVNQIKQLIDGIIRIRDGENELNSKEEELRRAEEDFNNGYNTYLSYETQLRVSEQELNHAFQVYYYNLNQYENNKILFDNKRIDFEKNINKAKSDIKNLEPPKWYINTREDNSDYISFINSGSSVENLAKIFPVVFFIVAIFMSIMSMSRMVLEDRGEIGTLKSLGYSNLQIMMKYIIYSVSATLIGGILGGLFGFYYLTNYIWRLYGLLYKVNEFSYCYNIKPFVIGIVVSLICIVGTTILTIISVVKEKTASLLRPKAPLSGQKMFVEKFGLWNKLSFSNKITIRNIVRYKKRVVMTIIGIMGCTVLLLSGYGIRDGIVNITNKQFGEVMKYDDMIYHNGKYELDESIKNNSDIESIVLGKTQIVRLGSSSVNLVGLEGSSEEIFHLVSTRSGKTIKLDDGVVAISSKLADLHKIKIGDTIKVIYNNEKIYELKVSDIFNNYINHHIYMNKNTYNKYVEEYDHDNMICIKFKTKEKENDIITEMIKDDNILVINNTENTVNAVSNILKTLDSVVYILLLFSGLLSFVVLYNLSYINISERKREIATLKVLGFYPHEVDNYIIKENFIITVIGIIIGLLIGKIFVDIIINTIEIDMIRFIHHIDIFSYIKTFLFMLLFTIIVSVIIHFALKKIEMIESLKSVE